MEEKTTLDAWLEIAEQIATETIYSRKQADTFVSGLATHGASPDIYGKKLISRVSSTCIYAAARVQANMLFMEYLQDRGINAKRFTHS